MVFIYLPEQEAPSTTKQIKLTMIQSNVNSPWPVVGIVVVGNSI